MRRTFYILWLLLSLGVWTAQGQPSPGGNMTATFLDQVATAYVNTLITAANATSGVPVSLNTGTGIYSLTTTNVLSFFAIGTNSTSINTVFLSKKLTPSISILGDPTHPFTTAQAASYACPDAGYVFVADGTFAENVVVTNNQNWVFADNTFLNGFIVTNQIASTNFNVTGLGTIGIANNSGTMLFSNNFQNIRFDCKNWLGGATFSTTNQNSTISINARDNLEFYLFNCADQTTQAVFVTAANITNANFISTVSRGVGITCGNKNFSLRGSKTIACASAGAAISAAGPTNINFYISAPQLLLSGLAARGNFAYSSSNQNYVVEGADVFLPVGPGVVRSTTVVTNELYFINCRLNTGGGSGFISTAGNTRVHYIGSVAAVANPATSATISNVVDNTVIDPTWTNFQRY